MECSPDGSKVCSRCGYKVEDPKIVRCPRCYNLLLTKCFECQKKCK